MTQTVHGGNILDAAERHGGVADDYLDFSANINPLGPPESVLRLLRERAADARALMRYPDQHYRALRSALSAHVACPQDTLFLGGGGAALLEAAVHTLRPATCLLPIPAFSEYHRALRGAGARIIPLLLRPEHHFTPNIPEIVRACRRDRPDLCLLANPHNPSGSLISAEELLSLASHTRALGITLIVDEAFIDYCPAESVTRAACELEGLIVLRSLTKFYAMPAMRVGYGIATAPLAARITEHLPSWPITTLAADAAVAALGDHDYEHTTRMSNLHERTRLALLLAAQGIDVVPSHANFFLLRAKGSSLALAEHLATEHRILVRTCKSYAGLKDEEYLRIAVRLPKDNDRLIAAL